MDAADEIIERYKALFGEDYYIEIQDHNIRDQKTVLPHLVRLARRHNVKIVATNDVHYLNKKDAAAQKVLQCISFRTTLSENEIDETEDVYKRQRRGRTYRQFPRSVVQKTA